MASMESDIFTNLKTRLEELSFLNLVEFERIRLQASDFRDHELPGIQMYDNGQDIRHEQGRVVKLWNIVLEMVMKSTSTDVVNQGTVLDRKELVERKIGSNVQLDLGSSPASQGTMSHIKYVSAITDLHLLQPLFLVTFNYQIEFRSPFVDEC
jgi:hypothetical protein